MAADPSTVSYKKGEKVEIFYRFGDETTGDYLLVSCAAAGLIAPRVGKSDGWIAAEVLEDAPAGEGYVHVRYSDKLWYNRRGILLDLDEPRNTEALLHPRDVRSVEQGQTYPPPALSCLVVRWGGYLAVGNTTEQWGPSNSSVSDTHIKMFFDGTTYSAIGPDYEVFTAFIEKSEDLARLHMPSLVMAMTGRHRCAFYHLWPVAFEVSSWSGHAAHQAATSASCVMGSATKQHGWLEHPRCGTAALLLCFMTLVIITTAEKERKQKLPSTP